MTEGGSGTPSRMRLAHRAWKDLASAHGTCHRIPEALRGLTDRSDGVRQAARWGIDNHVVLQGDLYEGAPWVARALIEMLRRADLPDRGVVVDLLVELARGSANGGSVPTTHGPIRLDRATRMVIADGLAVFEAERARGGASARLAQQVIDEIEEWRQDGGTALSG